MTDDIPKKELNHIEVENILIQEIQNKIKWAVNEYDFSDTQIIGILEFVKYGFWEKHICEKCDEGDVT